MAKQAAQQPPAAGGRTPRPVVIGLLGGIASGKSAAASALASAGAAVLDADRAAREALSLPEVVAALCQRFGSEVAPHGAVDREELSRRVFGHPDDLAFLEELVHPRVRAALGRELEQLLGAGSVPAVVLDVPLLLERSPLAERCDLLVFVEAPADKRRWRVHRRRGWSEEELARREAHQWPTERKRATADVVIHNDGTLEDLRRRIEDWLQQSGGFDGLPRRASAHPTRSDDHDRDADPERGTTRG